MTATDAPAPPGPMLFSLATGKPLLERIAAHLGVAPARHEERAFEDGEHKIRPLESVRDRDVYVVESLCGDAAMSVDQKLVRVLFLLAALGDAGAARVTAVAPYLCYARKDMRTKPRDPVSTRYVAALFEAVGVHRMVVVDVHDPAAYHNAFRIPAEQLTAIPLFVQALAGLVGDAPAVVVSPDAGGAKRAERFRRAFEQALGHPVGLSFVEKFRSEGVVRRGAVVGEVAGCAVIILDDLVSSGTTLAGAAAACRERGARAVYAACTHGVFSAQAGATLAASALERLVILDTIPPRGLDSGLLSGRVQVLDCAPLLATAIHRLHTGGSIVELTPF